MSPARIRIIESHRDYNDSGSGAHPRVEVRALDGAVLRAGATLMPARGPFARMQVAAVFFSYEEVEARENLMIVIATSRRDKPTPGAEFLVFHTWRLRAAIDRLVALHHADPASDLDSDDALTGLAEIETAVREEHAGTRVERYLSELFVRSRAEEPRDPHPLVERLRIVGLVIDGYDAQPLDDALLPPFQVTDWWRTDEPDVVSLTQTSTPREPLAPSAPTEPDHARDSRGCVLMTHHPDPRGLVVTCLEEVPLHLGDVVREVQGPDGMTHPVHLLVEAIEVGYGAVTALGPGWHGWLQLIGECPPTEWGTRLYTATGRSPEPLARFADDLSRAVRMGGSITWFAVRRFEAALSEAAETWRLDGGLIPGRTALVLGQTSNGMSRCASDLHRNFREERRGELAILVREIRAEVDAAMEGREPRTRIGDGGFFEWIVADEAAGLSLGRPIKAASDPN